MGRHWRMRRTTSMQGRFEIGNERVQRWSSSIWQKILELSLEEWMQKVCHVGTNGRICSSNYLR